MKKFESKKIYLIIATIILLSFDILACSTAIISGKATKDGRPIIWKHRDSDSEANHVTYFNDGKYSYYGIVNSENFDGKELWGGFNSAIFAIINSASYNLKPENDTTTLKDKEGELMKLALMTCATVSEFEELLKKLPKPLGVEANFGVIDAFGGAAYFETNNFYYIKFDVNDVKIAPKGYLIKTNFSFSGDTTKGFGFIGYETALESFESELLKDKISPEFLIQKVGRSLYHSRTKDNFFEKKYSFNEKIFKYFRDFIPRFSSTSSILIRGVKSGEDPRYATCFVSLGFPLVSPTFFFYNLFNENYHEWLKPRNNEKFAHAYLLSKQLKNKCFPITKGNGKDYILINVVINSEQKGYLDILLDAENKEFEFEKKYFETMLKKEPSIDEINKFNFQQTKIYENDYYLKILK